MALKKGIWDPKLRSTNIKGTNLKSLTVWRVGPRPGGLGIAAQSPSAWAVTGLSTLQILKGPRTQIIGF